MRMLSRLYAFMYLTRRRTLLGVRLSTWLLLLLLLLAMWTFLLRWPPWTSQAALIGAILLRAGYWLAERKGYTRFVDDEEMALDPEFAAPRDESRVPLRATGVFGVRDYEQYVLEEPAEYWRVPAGHHVIMVQNSPGSYLYQLVEPQYIRAVKPGYLLYGRRPQKALALEFLVSWSPAMAREPSYYPGAAEDPVRRPSEQRAIYFTFDHDADRFAVWRSLIESRPARE
jgi:hypothetical protein